jgi:predicted NACHT family NTPase
MAKRSLKASEAGIAKAKLAFQRRDWTQEYLAAEVGLQTRQSIWKFFSGKPIERHLFIDICFRLDLDWEEIVERPQFSELPSPETSGKAIAEVDSEPETWVEQVRSYFDPLIKTQCGLLQVGLDLPQPLPLPHVYTEMTLLPHLSNQRWLDAVELEASRRGDRTTRLAVDVATRQLTMEYSSISLWEAVTTRSKLVILGKPGSGKTTILQYLALQCSESKLYKHQIPIFISLRHLAIEARARETFQLDYHISQQWLKSGLTQTQINCLLQQGRALILLDGLDEVTPVERDQVLHHLQKFAITYYANPIIVTCRTAAQEYQLQGFTSMELADLNLSQIQIFVHKWFAAVNSNAPEVGATKAELFLQQLQQRENQPIQALAVTPILLHLMCLIFQERSTFPKKRSKLYQTGLDILLSRWDNIRGIQREETICGLSLSDKINILSQIAATTFAQGKLFFEKAELLSMIMNYLQQSLDRYSNLEALWLDAEAVLKAIAVQHGLLVEQAHDVYAFSHLTFQEYLTARKIFVHYIGTSDCSVLEQLASRITEPHWHEVLILTLEMLPQAEPLLHLMKQHLDRLLQEDATLQAIVAWTNQKAASLSSPCKSVAVCGFYLGLLQSQGIDLAVALNSAFAFNDIPELALDAQLVHILELSQTLLETPTLHQGFELCLALNLESRFQLNIELQQQLEQLRQELFLTIQQRTLRDWCCERGVSWFKQLQQTLIQYCNIGHDWQLDFRKRQRLLDYYRATQFLVSCLNNSDQLPSQVRSQLEQSLFTSAS